MHGQLLADRLPVALTDRSWAHDQEHWALAAVLAAAAALAGPSIFGCAALLSAGGGDSRRIVSS